MGFKNTRFMPFPLQRPYRAVYTTRLLLLCVSCLMILSACAGQGVLATSDPNKKLSQAIDLINSGRIAHARQLTSEAADIFAAQGDQKGQAAAHRQMAFLIRVYGEDAILGQANPAARKLDITTADKSNSYFERALAIHQKLKDHAMVSHLEYNIGVNYAMSDRTPQACTAFDRSLSAYKAEKRSRPEHDPALPPGVATFDAFISQAKLEAACG